MALCGVVCRAVMLEGRSQRSAAKRLGIDRGTVAKFVASPSSSSYRRKMPEGWPKVVNSEGFNDQILDDDDGAPAKQRHTVLRMFKRLRDKLGSHGAALEAIMEETGAQVALGSTTAGRSESRHPWPGPC